MKQKLRIRIDTREQTPLFVRPSNAWRFRRETVMSEPIDVTRWASDEVCGYADFVKGGIGTFDYALDGDQDNYAIERKSLDDFIGSLATSESWRRETAKVQSAHAAGIMPAVYVVEANMRDLIDYEYGRFTSGKVTSQYIFNRWSTLAHQHKTHIVWAGNRTGAEFAVICLLKRRAEELMIL